MIQIIPVFCHNIFSLYNYTKEKFQQKLDNLLCKKKCNFFRNLRKDTENIKILHFVSEYVIERFKYKMLNKSGCLSFIFNLPVFASDLENELV